MAQGPAGWLGALNPFVYDRVMEGQFGVAAGIGAVFLWLAAWAALQESPRMSRLLPGAGSSLVTGAVPPAAPPAPWPGSPG